jgi:hypothetical protein
MMMVFLAGAWTTGQHAARAFTTHSGSAVTVRRGTAVNNNLRRRNRLQTSGTAVYASTAPSTTDETTSSEEGPATSAAASSSSTTASSKMPDMDEIVSLCKRRGIIFPSSEIYNGYAGFFDYGPLGAELKKNLKDAWWKHFVTQREDVVGLDSSIIHNPTTWKSSGT